MSVDQIWSLLTKKFNNEISEEEMKELEMLLRQNQDAFQLNELFSNLENSRFKPVSDEKMKARSAAALKNMIGFADPLQQNQYEDFGTDNETAERYRRKRIKISAVLLACTAGLCFIIRGLPWKNKLSSKEPVAMNEVKTDAGSKSTINLPDGSVVVLNAGSRLSYNKEFGISTREIKLSGEAYFDIHKNPEMPLVVHAGNVDISVKGTTFNVKAYPGDSTVEAALLTGIIELVSQKDPERKILLRPNEKIIVSNANGNNANAAINQNNPLPAETVLLAKMKRDPADSGYPEIAWMRNKLVFRSKTFGELSHDLERRYHVSFQFTDAAVKDLIFTGSFTEETLPEALEALKATTPFQYRVENRTVLLRR